MSRPEIKSSQIFDNISSLKKTFYERVLMPDENGCMTWIGAKDEYGYGKLFIPNGKKSYIRTHRYSYALHYGIYDASMFVLHRCDNPSCVAPEHLFLGTQKDNSIDRHTKGRSKNIFKKGEDHVNAVISASEAFLIKGMLEYGQKGIDISRHLGVSTNLVSNIKTNKTWKHI